MHGTTIETFGRKFVAIDPKLIAPDLARHTLATFSDHEPVLESWCKEIRPGDVVVDAGACFGSYTLPALAAGAFVVAYEPCDDAYRILEANVRANGWLSPCKIRKLALFDGTDYPVELARQVFGTHYPAKGLQTIALDEDLDDLGIGHVDWIKLDVEGAELGVLMGAHKILCRSRPTLIIEDHEGVSPDPNDEVSRFPERVQSRAKIRELLEALGYSFTIHPWDVSRSYLVARPPARG